MVGKYPIITLCGSSRFKEIFSQIAKELTLKGNIVLSLGVFSHSDDDIWKDMDDEKIVETKKLLEDIHREKINMADIVYIINPNGYIGSSTEAEIDYAKLKGKLIRYYYNKEG